MRRTSADTCPGTVESGVLYHIDEFKCRTGFGDHAMRTARRNGLRVRYVGGRAFVKGEDFFAYIDKLDAAPSGRDR